LKGNTDRTSGCEFPLALILGSIMAVCSLLIAPQATASAASISADSNTILRMSKGADDRRLMPLYEYLDLSATNPLGDYGSLAVSAGGWGRLDLAHDSTDKSTESAFQYGYVSYRGSKNNLLMNVGRLVVTEGVAAERLDGIYLRGDLGAGFGAGAFVGSPVVTEPNFKGGDFTYGGRIGHSNPKYYSVGLSFLRTDQDGNQLREEEGVDLWLHPWSRLDVAGRSSYNSATNDWMEHSYTASYRLLESLRIGADASYIYYKAYFYQVTTSALSLTPNGLLDPDEKVLTLGGSIDYSPINNLTLTADYKNYNYDIAGTANYYGGKAAVLLPKAISAGLSFHRMDGETSRLRFDEYRVFASKGLGKADLTVDFFHVRYDEPIAGVDKTYSISAALAYAFTENLKVAADVNYLKDTQFDNAVAAFFKVTYSLDKKWGSEGRAKNEK
jgi:hypothetical protein